MGQQIIKQPNGLYCIYNSGCGAITYYDLTAQEILDVRVQEERDRLAWDLLKTLALVDAGKAAYYQFSKTFDEALEYTEDSFGKKEREELLADMMSVEDATKKLAESKLPTLPDDLQEMLGRHLKGE